MKPEINVTDVNEYHPKFERARKLFYHTDITYNYDSRIWSWNSTKTPVQDSVGILCAPISMNMAKLYG